MRHTLKKMIDNPTVLLMIGIILIFTSIGEVIEGLDELSIGTHHGVFIWGIFQVFSAIPHLVEGLERIVKTTD